MTKRILITKEFSVSFSHLLEDHQGLCKNLHGHNGKIIFTVVHNSGFYSRNNKSSYGMVIDFKDLKEVINDNIIDLMDHSFIYNSKDVISKDIAEFLKKKINQKVLPVSFRVTSEQLVEWILKRFNKIVEGKYPVECIKVELWETNTSSAVYIEDAN